MRALLSPLCRAPAAVTMELIGVWSGVTKWCVARRDQHGTGMPAPGGLQLCVTKDSLLSVCKQTTQASFVSVRWCHVVVNSNKRQMNQCGIVN